VVVLGFDLRASCSVAGRQEGRREIMSDNEK
jgi:hypothetical protein